MNSFLRVGGLAFAALVASTSAFAFSSSQPSIPREFCRAVGNNDVPGAKALLAQNSIQLSTLTCEDDYNNTPVLRYALELYINTNCPTFDMIDLLAKNGAQLGEVVGSSNLDSLGYAIAATDDPALASHILDLGAKPISALCTPDCGPVQPANVYPLVIKKMKSAQWVALLGKLLDSGMKTAPNPVDDINASSADTWLAAANVLANKLPGQKLFGDGLAYGLVANYTWVSSGMIDFALAHGARFDLAQGGNGMSPFESALENAPLSFVQLLLSRSSGKLATTDLFHGMRNRNRDVVDFVINTSPDLSAQMADGTTALMLALANRWDLGIVNEILARKQNLNLERSQSPSFALAIAAASSPTDVVQSLLAIGANPNQISSVDGQTALMVAAAAGRTDVVTMLTAIDKINVNAQDATGETALIYAVQSGVVADVVALLSKGACIKTVDSTGHTALQIAYDKGASDILSVIQVYLNQPGHC